MYVVMCIRKLFRFKKIKHKVFGPFSNHENADAYILNLKPWFLNKWRLKSIRIVEEKDLPYEDKKL
jgi:hypothetical protein